MFFTAHIPPHYFRPRPVRQTNRSAQPVDGSNPVEKVHLHLDEETPSVTHDERDIITVADVMETNIMAVPPNLPLEPLARLFMDRKVTGFPVVETDGTLVGLVSQKDLLACVMEHQPVPGDGFYNSMYMEFPQHVGVLPGGKVEDIMTPFVYFATPDTDIREVIDLMLNKGIHRVVVTEQKRLKGLVTNAQLLKVLKALL